MELIPVGRISGLYGVKGWVKVYSYTESRENIVKYNPWLIQLNGQWQSVELESGRRHGKGVVVKLSGFDDRDQVVGLLDAEIAINRSQLPPPKKGQYYWIDLIGLEVVNTQDEVLGEIVKMMPTGANDVVVVQGQEGEEVLIPYVRDMYVLEVDLEQKRMVVDWQVDY